ncbi:hypothetical protein HN51_050765, partial [Arachis hypogaea]
SQPRPTSHRQSPQPSSAPPAAATLLFLTVSARHEAPPAIVTPSRRHSCVHHLCARRKARLCDRCHWQ